jgi:hypothetical protein
MEPEVRFSQIPDAIIILLCGITYTVPSLIEFILLMVFAPSLANTIIATCDIFINCGYVLAGFKLALQYLSKSMSRVEIFRQKNTIGRILFVLFHHESVREHYFSAAHLLCSVLCWYVLNIMAGIAWFKHESITTFVFAAIAWAMYFLGFLAGLIYVKCLLDDRDAGGEELPTSQQ